FVLFFFFQGEDGIRVLTVTGVQTCALPICPWCPGRPPCVRPIERMVVMIQWELAERMVAVPGTKDYGALAILLQSVADTSIVRQIGRASCRESVWSDVVPVLVESYCTVLVV